MSNTEDIEGSVAFGFVPRKRWLESRDGSVKVWALRPTKGAVIRVRAEGVRPIVIRHGEPDFYVRARVVELEPAEPVMDPDENWTANLYEYGRFDRGGGSAARVWALGLERRFILALAKLGFKWGRRYWSHRGDRALRLALKPVRDWWRVRAERRQRDREKKRRDEAWGALEKAFRERVLARDEDDLDWSELTKEQKSPAKRSDKDGSADVYEF